MTTNQAKEQGIAKKLKAVLLVNARSRKGRRLFQDARRELSSRGISLTAAHQVRDPALFPGQVRNAVESGCRLIIVGRGESGRMSISAG